MDGPDADRSLSVYTVLYMPGFVCISASVHRLGLSPNPIVPSIMAGAEDLVGIKQCYTLY